MKITALEIDGYGVWSGLKVGGLSDGLNVFYGPNEAGKTTLLQFIRSMLYGFSPQRRRYLPPIHGGRPGGSVDVAGPNGRFQVGRFDAPGAEGGPREQLTLTAPDGTRQGEHFLKVLLSNVDEAIFNNVFAVGLREIQELNVLSDTEAAELLYNLTAGLDRVSLVEVMRELETSRNRILDANGKPCQVVQLLAEREKLRAEIEELAALSRRYGHLAAERAGLDREVARLQEDANAAEQQATVVELAIALRGRWAQRAALDEQLAALGPSIAMPEGAIERLDAIHARQQKHQQRIDQLAAQREAMKREFAELAVNESLWRQAARVEALKEQEPWITQLQGQAVELDNEIAELELELGAEGERLGLGSKAGALPTFSAKALAALRSPAKTLQECHRRRAEAAQTAADAKEAVDSLTRQIDSALSARGERDLAGAMDRAGNLVSQLRRRVQVDERLDQLSRYQSELEERGRQLVDRQLLPVWVLAGLGAAFVVGVVLVLAGLLMPTSITGSLGWALALLGLAGSGAAGFGKVMLERSNVQQLDACRKQLEILRLQVQQTNEDRDALDAQLPRGGGPIVSRLQAAERDLAALEELTPLDTRRATARQEAGAAEARLAQADEEHRAGRRHWRQAATSIGLPEDITPKQVRRLAQRCDRIAEMQRRLAQRREELSRRRKELDALGSRIVQLAADGGVPLGGTNPIEHLRQLGEAIGRQETAVARRETIRRQVRRNRAVQAKRAEAVGRLKHRRRELLIEAGAEDEREFRDRAVRFARAEVLRRDREALTREIQAALATHCSEDALRRQLEATAVPLETRRDDLRQRLAALRQQLHGLLEKRGQLAEQLNALAADRRLGAKHLQLATVEKRLDDAVRRWQVLAVTCRVLELIRTTYEKQRQPETLQEASGYLDRLTQGRYCRVWTPLGENVLRVDDAEGHSLPVEALSRGTREQLFLSLRLALTSCYARRGATLPLVLDDVLVNFDADRAKAAATVLRDFAAAGHQLLVFTCHEHILRLFKALRAPVSQLPSNAQPGPAEIRFEQRSDERPKTAREPGPPRKKPARAKRPKPHDEPAVLAARAIEPADSEPEDEEFASSGHSKDHTDRVFDADFFDPQEEPLNEEDAENAAEDDEDQWEDDADDDEEDLDEAEWENADDVEGYEEYEDDDAEAA